MITVSRDYKDTLARSNIPDFRGNLQTHGKDSIGFLQGILRYGSSWKKRLCPDGGALLVKPI